MKSFIWLDDKSKKLTWLNRNYFFGVTVLIVLINIILYAGYGSNVPRCDVRPHWGEFSFANLFQALICSYSHSNWQHVLLNMLCFLIAGCYLERKKGSLQFLLFMALMSFFTAFATCTNDLSLYWHGFSGVNFGMYGFLLIEVACMFLKKKERYLFNIIAGSVLVGLIYFAMCFCGGTARVEFKWYPYDLLNNLGHASGFFVGLLVGIVEQGTLFLANFKRE